MAPPEHRLAFATGDGSFGVRVAGACVEDGRVLLLRSDEGRRWVLPGGGVRFGEAAKDAIARELREELGFAPRDVRPLWLAESFFGPPAARVHEVGFYYRYALPPGSPWLDRTRDHVHRETHPGGETDRVYRWFPVAGLAAVPLYPLFLRERLRRLPDRFELVVNREDRDDSERIQPGPLVPVRRERGARGGRL